MAVTTYLPILTLRKISTHRLLLWRNHTGSPAASEDAGPFNLYTANGYVVYVLQPSGAIGYGQEFSARHQNNWGKITGDEIIASTKAFIKAHSFIDPARVGCMGASYGGFTTEYLTTQTDIFACAISHAGISSIAGYWGEGTGDMDIAPMLQHMLIPGTAETFTWIKVHFSMPTK